MWNDKLTCEIGGVRVSELFQQNFCSGETYDSEIHRHAYYEMHIVESGSAILENIDGSSKMVIDSGHFVVIPPYYYHSLKIDDNTTFKEYTLKLDIKFKSKQSNKSSLDEPMARVWDSNDQFLDFYLSDAVELLKQIRVFLNSETLMEHLLAESYFKIFMLKFFSVIDKQGNSLNISVETDDFYDVVDKKRRMEEFFENNYFKSKITAADMAKELNYSVRHLNRFIAKVYGTSFHKILIDVRLTRAKKMLATTDTRIGEIAAMVGYDSPSAFALQFKKNYGQTPSEYRESTRIQT